VIIAAHELECRLGLFGPAFTTLYAAHFYERERHVLFRFFATPRHKNLLLIKTGSARSKNGFFV
jgi:hypothetical protein